jgi:hypothetical protein
LANLDFRPIADIRVTNPLVFSINASERKR